METTREKSIWGNLLLISIAILIIIIAGCAVKQKIKVNSEPAGATVIFKNIQMARTPAVIMVDKKDKDIMLRIEKEGYKPVEVELKRRFDGWFVPKLVVAAALGSSRSLITEGTKKGTVIPAAIGFVVGTGTGLFYGLSSGYAYKISPSEFNVVMTELNKQGMKMEDMPQEALVLMDMETVRK